MPVCARRAIVREGEPVIYHCWSRCCRRAYLLGMDPLTGKDHNHRRQWVVERLHVLVVNISWRMVAISEYVARRANGEDECLGRCFEGRFSCREIGAEGALPVCGLYVNPAR